MHIHLIGSEGVSMKWIAGYFRGRGAEVTVSDLRTGGHDPSNVKGADLVIYTSAIEDNNVELVAAREAGMTVLPRSEALARIARDLGFCIAVAGTHGKTTVTAMTAYALAAYRPAAHFGGTVLGKTGATEGDMLVTEACEYKRNFLTLSPDMSVVLNIELDHTDCYDCFSAVLGAFSRFAAQSETVIVPEEFAPFCLPRAGGRQVCVGRRGSYALIDRVSDGEGSDIAVKTPDGILRTRLNVIGRHNADNAVYAVAAAHEYGATLSEIADGLAAFPGVDRRLQRKGSVCGKPLFSDYAHHPTEIRAGIRALRDAGYSRPLVLFRPHTYARLTSLFKEFAISLLGVRSIILPVFRARGDCLGADSYSLSREIVSRHGTSEYAAGFAAAAELARSHASDCDVVILMGAGDEERILPMLCDETPCVDNEKDKG